MKKLFAICLSCLALTAQAAIIAPHISQLPQITTPSTNTYLEVADMSATPKSRKYWLVDLKGYIATNLTDAQIAANAAIAKSKISTNSTWAVADIPTLPQSKITSLTSDLAGKVDTLNGGATNLNLAGANVTTTNLTWNTETLSPSSSTNFVLDFLSPRTALITATNDVNWLNSTNRTASTATERNKKVRILASGANRLVTLHSSWLLVGSTTRTMTVTNGTWAVIALDNAGASETNVFTGMIYAQ